jgi:hypothetical protein
VTTQCDISYSLFDEDNISVFPSLKVPLNLTLDPITLKLTVAVNKTYQYPFPVRYKVTVKGQIANGINQLQKEILIKVVGPIDGRNKLEKIIVGMRFSKTMDLFKTDDPHY